MLVLSKRKMYLLGGRGWGGRGLCLGSMFMLRCCCGEWLVMCVFLLFVTVCVWVVKCAPGQKELYIYCIVQYVRIFYVLYF